MSNQKTDNQMTVRCLKSAKDNNVYLNKEDLVKFILKNADNFEKGSRERAAFLVLVDKINFF